MAKFKEGDMTFTGAVNTNGGIQIDATIRNAKGIKPGDLIEVTIGDIKMKAEDRKDRN